VIITIEGDAVKSPELPSASKIDRLRVRLISATEVLSADMLVLALGIMAVVGSATISREKAGIAAITNNAIAGQTHLVIVNVLICPPKPFWG
jgi:hypothetical protein